FVATTLRPDFCATGPPLESRRRAFVGSTPAVASDVGGRWPSRLKHRHGVGARAVYKHLQVQVARRRGTGRSGIADELALLYLLSVAHGKTLQVIITRNVAAAVNRAVIDQNLVP